MIDAAKEKSEVVEEVLRIWQESFPHLRLGQMLMNLVEKDWQLFYLKDEDLLIKLKAWEERSKLDSNK